ncbi:hypothetical protein G6F63_014454 [Rhizopus arrhizus]|nr:hypothetical protein G6F63_014454 [Rhizopus arrhizus]
MPRTRPGRPSHDPPALCDRRLRRVRAGTWRRRHRRVAAPARGAPLGPGPAAAPADPCRPAGCGRAAVDGAGTMTPVQRRRLVWVLLALLASGLATALVAMALERNIAYLYTPAEVLRGDVDAHCR